jgi:hypothetical protein
MRRAAVWLLGFKAVLGAAVALGYVSWRDTYPYGYSHRCDLNLYLALEKYAAAHGGAFPTGGRTPEASLGLLYKNVDWVTADLLRGKTVPESVVQETLDRGGPLGPESCGWHYVEGLRVDDDPRLALFWDKVGLGHNGERLSCGGHIVMFLDGRRPHIPEVDWQTFLDEQERLLAQRARGSALHLDAAVPAGRETLQVQLRVVDDGLCARVWRDWWGPCSVELIADIDREPEVGAVGLPVVAADELRDAKAVAGPKTGTVRFVLKRHTIAFDGNDFIFEPPGK